MEITGATVQSAAHCGHWTNHCGRELLAAAVKILVCYTAHYCAGALVRYKIGGAGVESVAAVVG